MKLLFIEDNLQIRENYRDFLLTYFSNIYETDSSIEALTLFKENKPDVILIDINIKGSNGIEVIKEIRKIDKKIKIIILSAHKDENYLFSAINLNVNKYLVKPVKTSEFRDALTKVLEEIKKDNIIYLEDSYIWSKKEKILYYEGKVQSLTKKELQFFEVFCTKSIPYFTFESIYFTIYNDIDEFNINKVKMLIKRLRKKTSQNLILNIYGLGYKFNYI